MRYLFPVLLASVMACSESPSTDRATAEVLAEETVQPTNSIQNMTFYDFKVTSIDGNEFDLSTLKGKRVLVVNTASECGYTPQYAQLQELYEVYGGDKFTIVGFPSNDFGGQEPGSDAEIKTFCTQNYGVNFPMMSKITVKGAEMHPLYSWLTSEGQNGVSDAEVKWNFHKFLIDADGKWVAEYPSGVTPLDDRITGFAKGE